MGARAVAGAIAIAVISACVLARAETVELDSIAEPRPIVGFRAQGDTKLTDRTLSYLARIRIGDRVSASDIPEIVQALISSELFETVDVTLEDAPGDPAGVIVVATLDDKHSWIVAPTLYFLAGARAFGVGFAENNLFGRNQKLLLYGQYGSQESLLFGTFLDPSVRGSRLRWRFDIYGYRRSYSEYANPVDEPANHDIYRTTTTSYLGGGILVGWTFDWWLFGDLRVRGARLSFDDPHAPDGSPLPPPQDDGFDVSQQLYITADARQRYFGVTWGPYAQLLLDAAIPGLDEYGYQIALLRAYYSWRFFEAHQLELRTILHVGRNLPYHEELSLGGAVDLRGYAVGRYRGDLRTLFRAEYSVPIAKWRSLAFRALGFWDTGYVGYYHQRDDRDYVPGHENGTGWWRNDVGAGFRIYLKAIVLPLLGVDVAYGIEGERTEVYFQAGLTDF